MTGGWTVLFSGSDEHDDDIEPEVLDREVEQYDVPEDEQERQEEGTIPAVAKDEIAGKHAEDTI
jgi:hypothetical protein